MSAEMDEIVFLESQWYEEGKKDALAHEHDKTLHDAGKATGFVRGFEFGVELSYIQQQLNNEKSISLTKRKKTEELQSKIQQFSLHNDPNFHFLEQMDSIRSLANSVGIASFSKAINGRKEEKERSDW
jgi:hypothetical protein